MMTLLFFYVGRCSVSSYTDEKGIGKLSIECDCETYKYKLQPTIMSVTINGTQAITLTNDKIGDQKTTAR